MVSGPSDSRLLQVQRQQRRIAGCRCDLAKIYLHLQNLSIIASYVTCGIFAPFARALKAWWRIHESLQTILDLASRSNRSEDISIEIQIGIFNSSFCEDTFYLGEMRSCSWRVLGSGTLNIRNGGERVKSRRQLGRASSNKERERSSVAASLSFSRCERDCAGYLRTVGAQQSGEATAPFRTHCVCAPTGCTGCARNSERCKSVANVILDQLSFVHDFGIIDNNNDSKPIIWEVGRPHEIEKKRTTFKELL